MGLMAGEDVDSDGVDGMFRQVPTGRGARWDLMRGFFARWYGALEVADGCGREEVDAAEARLGFAIPVALREWYELAGKRESVWCVQDRWLRPGELHVESGHLILGVENQGVVIWGIPLGAVNDADSAVFVTDPANGTAWIEEVSAVSVFALTQMLLNVKFAALSMYAANGQATDESLKVIASNYQRLDFPDLHWPPSPTRLYGRGDVLIETEAETWVWVSARTEASFRSAVELIEGHGVQRGTARRAKGASPLLQQTEGEERITFRW